MADYDEIKIPFTQLQATENIATLLDMEQLQKVGSTVCDWYTTDKDSRYQWERKTQDALKLALQVVETKSYPWPNASNVKFPLITIAALQFSARVYPALVKAPDLVKFRVMGKDPQGQKASRALRISRFMSYQFLEENEGWEEEQDKLFIILPILGCVFKKTYHDPLDGQIKSKMVMPQDLVLHYYTKDMERSRATEIFELYAREIKERQLSGLYLDDGEEYEFGGGDVQEGSDSDDRQGITPPSSADMETPREVLESHCFWDFDGDGYAEPYTITVDKESGRPFRIVSRFQEVVTEQSVKVDALKSENFRMASTMPNQQQMQQMQPQQQSQVMVQARQIEAKVQENQKKIEALQAEDPDILRIVPRSHYTKYSFIPAPDGGFYDLGFGQLLGPLNASVNTIINQLVDSGTMQNGSQGFIGKGARIQGGATRFEPFEWKRVNVAGSTLKESIVPLPVNQPSNVLFQLLGMLVSYAERVSSVSEIMQGDNPGQNTPASSMQSMLEQGLQVFNGVFKRIYRSFRRELRTTYTLNSLHLDPEQYIETMDGDLQVLQEDFKGDSKDIMPAADPNAFSNMEKVMKAQFLMQRSAQAPGYNTVAVEKRILEAMDMPDVDEVYPVGPDGQPLIPPPPNKELEIEAADMQRRVMEGKVRGEIDAARADAEIGLKEAQAQKIVFDLQNEGREAEAEQLKMLLEQQKGEREERKGRIDLLIKRMDVILKEKDIELADKKIEAAEAAAKAKAEAPTPSG